MVKDAADVGRTESAHPLEVFETAVVVSQLLVRMEFPVGVVVEANGLYFVIFEEDRHLAGDGGVDAYERAVLLLDVVQAFGVAHNIHAAELSLMDSSGDGDSSYLIELCFMEK